MVTLTGDEVLRSMKYGAWLHYPAVTLGKMTVTNGQGTPVPALRYTFLSHSNLKANNTVMENVENLKPDRQLTQGTTQSGPKKPLAAFSAGLSLKRHLSTVKLLMHWAPAARLPCARHDVAAKR